MVDKYFNTANLIAVSITLLLVGNATHHYCTLMHYRTMPNDLELNTLLGSEEVNWNLDCIMCVPIKAQAQILHSIQKFKWVLQTSRSSKPDI